MNFPSWPEALTALLSTHATPPWAEWTVLSGPGWPLAAWDDPRHQQGTSIPVDSPSSYVERFVTIHWDRGIVHYSQCDSKTGAGDATYDLSIPPDWLEALKKMPWPITGASPLF